MSSKTEVFKFYLICYQIYSSVGNCITRNEHPIDFIARINKETDEVISLVNFWEMTEEQYHKLEIFPTMILTNNLPSLIFTTHL